MLLEKPLSKSLRPAILCYSVKCLSFFTQRRLCQCLTRDLNSCMTGDQALWTRITAAKNTCLNLWTQLSSTLGIRVAATKLVTKVIQTQTRGSIADPRQRSVATGPAAEPSLALCSTNHPFLNAQALEDEAKLLLEESIKMLYVSRCAQLSSFSAFQS